MFPENLKNLLENRKLENNYRSLQAAGKGIDFYSNDYLGLSRNVELLDAISNYTESSLGSSGSRLMSGTTEYMLEVEDYLANNYGFQSATVFNSGYMANMGLLSCLGNRDDTIVYDQHIHASCREGIRASQSRSFSFKHNDYQDLEDKLKRSKGNVYLLLEGIYSMNGDSPNPEEIQRLQEKYSFYLIIDEAHSVGVLGKKGQGWSEDYPLPIFAKVVTMGKAMGYHGGIVLGSKELKEYIINFSRPFIYTTAPAERTFYTIKEIHSYMNENFNALHESLQDNILYFNKNVNQTGLTPIKIMESQQIEKVHQSLKTNGIQSKIIKYPTIEKGKEIVRICVHNFNTKEEMDVLIKCIQDA